MYKIPREEQDAFALRSQHRAAQAARRGRFDDEIVPVRVPGKGGEAEVRRDEHPRPDTTLQALARLPPVFKEEGGTVTAGNSSGITDGAAAMVVLSAERAAALGVQPLARVVGVAAAGVDPHVMGIGVVPAVRRLLERPRLRSRTFDLVEMNEAFAAQVLACDRELRLDPRAPERERRRHRPRAPDRGHGRAHRRSRCCTRWPAAGAPRPGHALHQRRHGHGGGVRGQSEWQRRSSGRRRPPAAPRCVRTSSSSTR